MKKIALGVIMILMMSLIGCSKGNDGEPESTSEVTGDLTQEQTTEEKLEPAKGLINDNKAPFSLTLLGHASTKIVTKSGVVIYIDPYYDKGDYSQEADLILVTHSHSDHNNVSLCTKKDTTQVIDNKAALVDAEYKTFEFEGVKIEAVPASNSNHNIKACVGYLISFDGITVYHAGDTSKLDSMTALKDKKIDIAMYPIDGDYNMDAVEATDVAGIVGAKYNIPMHESDMPSKPKKALQFNPEGKTCLEYGQTISLEEYVGK